MRNRNETDLFVIHCSYTKPDMDIGADEIRRWHVEERGWNDIGYHMVIRRDGDIEVGRDIEAIGAHVLGHNKTSVGICLVGGMSDEGGVENNFTDAQFDALRGVLFVLNLMYPNCKTVGHRDLNVHKECPAFDVEKWLEEDG